MSDTPADWGFDEYITDPTAGGWYKQNWYYKNGEKVTREDNPYYPDATSDFALDFIRRHQEEPFFFYLSSHLIHGPIKPTPDSKPGAPPHEIYNDNFAYLDKIVGKMVDELDKIGLREETVVIFTTDNGTSRIGYQETHDPKNLTGNINGCPVNGRKGQLLEGRSRVPLIASWKGTLPAGGQCDDLIDFSDILPTFAGFAGTELPEKYVFDGRSFAPRLHGKTGNPRQWVFVQLGEYWYVRGDNWKLTRDGTLYSMDKAPFAEMPLRRRSRDPEAVVARKMLQAALNELNPDGKKGAPQKKPDKKRRKRRRKDDKSEQAQP